MVESREGCALMKYWHDEAYKLLSQALDLDEKGGGRFCRSTGSEIRKGLLEVISARYYKLTTSTLS